VAATLALATVGCGNGEDRSGGGSATGTGSASGTDHRAKPSFSAADADTVVTTRMREFAFEGMPASVRGPRVFFEVSNEGELVVVDPGGKRLGETGEFTKGDGTRTLALELQPGRYRVQCLVKLGDRTHLDEGMEAVLSVE
jgi:hypothetical protein